MGKRFIHIWWGRFYPTVLDKSSNYRKRQIDLKSTTSKSTSQKKIKNKKNEEKEKRGREKKFSKSNK